MPFVLLLLGILGLGLLGLLLLNTLLAQDGFRLQDLQHRGLLLADRRQQLDQALTVQGSPTLLARRAAALSMVPGADPRFVRLADGRVVAIVSASPTPVPPAAGVRPAVAGAAAAKPAAGPRRTPTPAATPR